MPTQHKGVSAAEKYAELEARGEERPKCECHEKPLLWVKCGNPEGGYFVKCRRGAECRSRANELRRNRYREDHEYRERENLRHREWSKKKYATDDEWRGKVLEQSHEWVRQNGERVRATQRNYRTKNRDKRILWSKSRYYTLKELGLCTKCGKDIAITETRCFSCLGQQDEYNMLRERIYAS